MPNATLIEGAGQSTEAVVDSPEPKPSRRKTSMVIVNFWLDAALLLSVAFLGWVSAMMQVVFPAPTAAGGWELWGLTFDQWRDLQFGSLCVFGLLALEHLALHWNWVCGVIATKVLRVKNRPDEGINAVYGVATFIGILTVMLASVIVAILTVKRPPM
ncbi:MAG: hypothetical protein P4L84_24040 [Isosphaeraceae bacterium]|nr:hypothetical protein [Isosphaeraceae bacterium]